MSSLKMKKFVSIKGVIDNIRQSVNTPSPPGSTQSGPVKLEQDIVESLVPDQFTVENTIRHGFPFKPISVAFDPIQKLLAIGNRTGSVRIFGRPGIDLEINHENEPSVLQIIFIVNTGELLTACTDDTVNLWSFKKKVPELVQSLKLQRERLTVVHCEFQDKWVYIGTEKGNLHVMNLENFSLSGYQISWNKLIDPLSKGHPGPISHVSVSPVDSSKLLIGFDSGMMCIWDLPSKKGEQRYLYPNQKLFSISWHMEGRQFVSTYGDGSIVTWSVKTPAAGGIASCSHNKPVSVIFPHGKKNSDTGKLLPCDPIDKILWRVNRNGDSYFVFSGGLPSDVTGVTPSITIMQGKNTTLLEMEYCVLDFILVTDSPFPSDYQDPEAIIAMLTNDVVAIDCKSSGYPCFKNPYAMDFNESPVTCCHYVVDCHYDLIPCLYMVGSKGKKEGSNRNFSSSEWPVNGGNDSGVKARSYAELVITGHADGSIRFWDSSSTSMQSLYRVRTAKLFEKVKKSGGGAVEGLDDDPYAIMNIAICPESKLLLVSGSAAHVIVFKFKKKETQTDTISLEIPIIYEVSSGGNQSSSKGPETSPPTLQHFEFPPRPLLNVASQSSSYTDPVDGFNFDKPLHEFFSPLRVRQGAQRKSPGYHAELVCLTPWVNGEAPSPISCLAINSNYGLVAYGNGSGLVIVDVIQNVCLLNMGTADLYGSQDPFHRMPKSPRPFDPSPIKDEIVRVDLSNYSQIATPPLPQTTSTSGVDTGSNSSHGTPASSSASAVVPPAAATTTAATSATISFPPRDQRVKSPDCKRLQKTGSSAEDSSMSKSQSSSINSLDQVITAEGVTAVSFADSFPTKNDYLLNPSLYVGTSLGSLVVVVINLPEKGEARSNEPVVVSPSGSVYRIRGPVLTMCFLDCSINSLSGRRYGENVKTSSSTRPNVQVSGNEVGSSGDQQIVVVCTEKSAAVFALPSQRQMYSQTINESSSVIAANIIKFGDGPRYMPCLVTYTQDGHVKAYSLPSLRPMLDMYFVAESSKRIGYTMRFADYGHGLYFCNPTELQKFSISVDFMRQLPDMIGCLFQENIPMPDPPKQGFLKGLFGGGPKPCDREELFGETAGKPNTGVAKHIPGASMNANMNKAVSATSEVAKAKMALVERGQKLNELEERTEQMANEAKNYAANAQKLKLAYQNKKWYQI